MTPGPANPTEPLERLASVKCLMIDMDGVLFRGQTRLPGADELFGWLTSRGVRFRMLTNNATATPEQNAARLAGLGIPARPQDIFTSAQATAAYLSHEKAGGKRAFVVGEAGLRSAVTGAGIEISSSAEDVQWVVVGLDRDVTYEVLREACFAIEHGARFVASNADSSLPVEQGNAPGAGALIAAIMATTSVKPIVIGKPESAMLEQTMGSFGVSAAECAMLGDRLDTDIEAAARLNILSVLVLTGVTTPELFAASPSGPDLVFSGLPEMMRSWNEALHGHAESVQFA